jgi:hypothetical protein
MNYFPIELWFCRREPHWRNAVNFRLTFKIVSDLHPHSIGGSLIQIRFRKAELDPEIENKPK